MVKLDLGVGYKTN